MKEWIENNEYIPLTPKIAKDYLLFKKEYEGKDFSSIREFVIENGFNEYLLCSEINNLRGKRIDLSTKYGQDVFNTIFDTIFWPKIKNNNRLDKKEFKSLVGTLMFAAKKTKQLTDNFTKDIAEVLSQLFEERKQQEIKKQKKEEKKWSKIQEIKDKERYKLQQETEINTDLYAIFMDIQTEYTNKKPVDEKLTSEERESLFNEAWDTFIQTNPKLSQEKRKEIYNLFYTNYIY